MMKAITRMLAAGGLLLATPALAGQGSDALRAALYHGALGEGIATLTPMAAGGDEEARFGLGMLQFLTSVEGVAQAFYRYGAAPPDTGPLGPVFGLPVPANANPEPIDYDKFRAVLSDLVTGMDAARETLAAAGESGDYAIPIDLTQVRLDINGDGTADASESIGGLFQVLSGADALPAPDLEPQPQAPDASGKNPPSAPFAAPDVAPAGQPTTIAFDRADAFWLAGYSEVFAMQGDFLLAHDFSEFFNVSFHRLFPRAGLLMQQYSKGGGTLVLDPDTDAAIADLIAAIHTLNWPVIDAGRLKGILDRAHAVVEFSRKDWDAILAETDDDHELLPSPTQTSPTGMAVTSEQVAAWRATLDKVDDVLAGKLLLPHWRFKQGFDLRAYFETATRTDVVMLMTGAGAIPFLRDGPVASGEDFAAADRAFGENLLGYAFWFN